LAALPVAAGCSSIDRTSASSESGLTSGAALATPTQQQGNSSAILMQGFHWNSPSYANPSWYRTIQNNAADLKDLGVTHVWFPPPADSGDDHGYLPRKLDVLSSKYGTQTELVSAIGALRGLGVQAIGDVVINHRVGTTDWADFTSPSWSCTAVASDDEFYTAHGGTCATRGARDTGSAYGSARDLDHTDGEVQSGITTWLTGPFKGLGFTGVRYDFAMGYRGGIQATYTSALAPDFCVDEVWTNLDLNNVDAHRQIEMNYMSGDGASCSGSNDATCGAGNGGTCGTFDFTTHGLLVQVLANNDYWRLKDAAGKAAGAIGWWPAMEVTFVDNHDTGPAESCGTGQNLWSVPCGAVMQGYAYVLTHPGIPTVFWPHVYDWGLRGAIRSIIQARTSMGITSTSALSIQQATTGLYAAIVTGTKGQVAMKIGPNAWSPPAGFTLAASGPSYAVWTSGGGSTTCTTVPATFTIANANTVVGDSLYVVGNQAALGSWTPASGFKLAIQGSGANATWSGTVQLPPSTAIQYKYVKLNSSSGAVTWESNQPTASGNRETSTAACGGSSAFSDGSFHF